MEYVRCIQRLSFVFAAMVFCIFPVTSLGEEPECESGRTEGQPLAEYLEENPGYLRAAAWGRVQEIVDILASRVQHSAYFPSDAEDYGVYHHENVGIRNPFWVTWDDDNNILPHAWPAFWYESPLGDPFSWNANASPDRRSLLVPSVSLSGCNWTQDGLSAPDFSNTGLLTEMFAPSLSFCSRGSMMQPDDWTGTLDGWGDRGGFYPRGIDLGWGVSPGDYPPISNNPLDSTSPLVPLQNPRSPSSAMYAERAVEGDSLDLLTGQPLLREIDFELPFGSAVYRQVRTYSELPRFAAHHSDRQWAPRVHKLVNTMDLWWSWHGGNWMISENPLFLIDAEYGGGEIAPDSLRRCYFVPDAHHAIPFELMETSTGPRYVAPAWFDADLTFDDGEWDADTHMWVSPPTRFYVKLFGGEITYEIQPYYEDVTATPPQVNSSGYKAALESLGHQTLNTLLFGDDGLEGYEVDDLGGRGTPYYGLVEVIRDRAGNEIRITYDDGHAPKPHVRPDGVHDETMPVVRTMQEGYRKGMIDRVELFAAGEDTPTWTMLYTYRTFLNLSGIGSIGATDCTDLLLNADRINQSLYWDFYSIKPAIHSIVVYKGEVGDLPDRETVLFAHPLEFPVSGSATPFIDIEEVTENGVGNCNLIVKPNAGGYNTPLDYQENVIGPAGEGPDSANWSRLPSDWVRQVQYGYSEPEYFYGTTTTEGPAYPIEANYYAAATGELRNIAHYTRRHRTQTNACYLVKVTSKQRIDSSAGSEDSALSRFWMYRYQDVMENWGGDFFTLGQSNYNTDADYKPDGYGNYIGSDHINTSESTFAPRRLKYRYGPETVDRMLTAWKYEKYDIDTDSNWFVDASMTPSEYVNGVISAADWDSIAWTVNDATVGFPGSYGLMPIDPYTANCSFGSNCGLHSGGDGGEGGDGGGGGTEPIEPLEPIPYRLLALHYLADRTFLGWNETYRIAHEDDPSGVPTSLWVPGETPVVRWDDREVDPDGVSAVLASWREFWDVPSPGQDQSFHSILRGDYLGKRYRGDTTSIAPERRVGFLPGGAAIYGEGSGDTAVYRRVYRFICVPDGHGWRMATGTDYDPFPGPEVIVRCQTDSNPNSRVDCSRAIYRYPYRFVKYDDHVIGYDAYNYANPDSGQAAPGQIPLDEVMWWTVVDEFDSFLQLRQGFHGWKKRRIIGLNPAGRVLIDQHWTPGNLAQSNGVPQKSYKYDEEGRLIAEYSRGYGAAVSDNVHGNEGLVTEFEYVDPVRTGVFDDAGYFDSRENPNDPGPPSSLVKAISIRKGDHGAPMTLRTMEWDEKGNLAAETDHPYSDGGPDSEPLSQISIHTEYADSDTDLIRSRTTVHAGIEVEPGAAPLKPFEREVFDDSGRRVWRIYGLAADPVAGPSGDHPQEQVYIDYTKYDGRGRVVFEVVDIDLSNDDGQGTVTLIAPHLRIGSSGYSDLEDAPEITEVETALLALFTRKAPAGSEPLNLVTYSAYNDFGRTMHLRPNGLRTITKYVVTADSFVQLEASGVYFDENGTLRIRSGAKSVYTGGSLEQAESYDLGRTYDVEDPPALPGSTFDALVSGIVGNSLIQSQHLKTTLEPMYDSAGRVSGIRATDPEQPNEEIVGYVFRDGWGRVIRSENADGDTTRNTYDWLGRLHKTFRGTTDTHPRWRGVNDPDSDDMVLTERLFYGSEPSNAFLPTYKWVFNSRSDEQYGGDWGEVSEGADEFADLWRPSAGVASNAVTQEHYLYDWRMRRIGTEYAGFVGESMQPLRREVLWLDNLDRVRYRAVYNGDAGDVQSADIESGDDLPPVTGILEHEDLLSLEETIYNAAGQVQETRRYDVDSTSPSYLSTLTYSDHENRPLWTRSGNEITKNLYNTRGQLIRTSRWATDGTSEYEVSRTINAVNAAEGVVEASYTWERIGDGVINGSVAADLDALASQDPPGVSVSAVYNWYDAEKRVVSTADLGRVRPSGPVTIAGFADSNTELPARPPSIGLVFHEIEGSDSVLTRWLEGYTYPGDPADPSDPWFDEHGRAVAVITCFDYDSSGNQRSVLRTNGCSTDGVDLHMSYTTTWTKYSGFGQRELELTFGFTKEGDDDPVRLDPHGTAYRHKGSRVTRIAAVLPEHFGASFDDSVMPSVDWDADDRSLQVTRIEYNAAVIDADRKIADNYHPETPPTSSDWISNRPDLVSGVFMPDPETGQPADTPAYRYFYRADGSLAGRADARGVVFDYRYDADGNTTAINAGTFTGGSALPAESLLGTTGILAPVRRMEMTYDPLGRLLTASAGSGGSFPFKVTLDYDSWGNLLSETQFQAIGYAFGDATRTISYDWEVGASGSGSGTNDTRLLGMTYPGRTMGSWDDSGNHTPREVHYDYGPSGSFDNVLGRVRGVSSTGGPGFIDLGHVATYAYDGGRLVSAEFGDRHCSGGVHLGAVLHETRASDRHGRVSEQRVVNRGCDGVWSTDPIFEARHGHDEAGRRLFTRLRQADFETVGDRDNIRSLLYEYDTLGRLTGVERGELDVSNRSIVMSDPLTPHTLAYRLDRLGNRVGDGAEPGFSEFFGLDSPVVAHTAGVDGRNRVGALYDETGGGVDIFYGYDAAGNLTSDGRYEYYYDAFSRLVAVRDTQIEGTDDEQIVLTLAYDALGRLVHRVTPWEAGVEEPVRIELFWYDGSRRIQDIVIDPYPASIPWLGLEPVEPGGGPEGGPDPQVRLEAEYIYAAHAGAGVDELHAVIDWFDRVAFPIQDAGNGTVQGYATSSGEVAEQYAWDPFGRLLERDAFPVAATEPSFENGFQGGHYLGYRLRPGHHGLLAEPMAAGDEPFDTRASALRAGQRSIYHNRNRTYDPFLGRFFQHDPNSTGQVLASLASQGRLGWSPPGAFDAESWLGDGANLYAAYGHDPVNATDPAGLFIQSSTGQKYNPEAGVDATGLVLSALQGLVEGYVDNLMSDVMWAMDWDADDEWHSRLNNDWMIFAVAQGVMSHFEIDLLSMPMGSTDSKPFTSNRYRYPIPRRGLPGENLSSKMGYNKAPYKHVAGFKRGRYLDGEMTIGRSKIGHEAKTGASHASRRTYTQIQKDEVLLRDRQYDKIVWTFKGVGGTHNLPGSLAQRLQAAKRAFPGRFIVEFAP